MGSQLRFRFTICVQLTGDVAGLQEDCGGTDSVPGSSSLCIEVAAVVAAVPAAGPAQGGDSRRGTLERGCSAREESEVRAASRSERAGQELP